MTDDPVSRIHTEFRDEALRSPQLFADVAQLERYVAESYSARAFVELLQNADDAGSTRFDVRILNRMVICANNGRVFTESDLSSLCRSGASNKIRGSSIGYRGIGFKSVVSLASTVHLISGNIKCTFSRSLTSGALGVPEKNVPLVRIPHAVTLTALDDVFKVVDELLKSGMTTIFVFDGIDHLAATTEVAGLGAECLAFLRNVTSFNLQVGDSPIHYNCSRDIREGTRRVTLQWPDRIEAWDIVSKNNVDVAFAIVDGRRSPMRAEAALVHAYLPTLEQTGLGVRINADFSTDPSRTRIVLDDVTMENIQAGAELIASMIGDALSDADAGTDTLACLAANFDTATIEFQRPTFRTIFVKALRQVSDSRVSSVALRPSWLNASDFDSLMFSAKRTTVRPAQNEAIEVQIESTLKYMGARRATDNDIAIGASQVAVSNEGKVELVAYAIRSVDSGIKTVDALLDVPGLWESASGPRTIRNAMVDKIPPSAAFSEKLKAKGLSPERMKVLTGLSGEIDPSTSEQNELGFVLILGQNQGPAATAIRGWRRGENVVAAVLRQNGFTVEDRSRQNLGYDLMARKDGHEIFIEVKFITRPGDPFIMTSNEEAVARGAGLNYYVALVRDLEDFAEIALIQNPANTLPLERQCRQWVWECSRYNYLPSRYKLSE